ncbi:phosphoethanolamine transferase [Shewanella inventionis]|uniref:Phosphoethanolamine transferase n=1 Tax=Shewanella inventionis TaxID=1738770 RepID=A0ABQ1IM52_9GAMM|nr:phosphoethanolamine transferase [Shewanella inventionis]
MSLTRVAILKLLTQTLSRITPKSISYEVMTLIIAVYFGLVLNFPIIRKIYQLSTEGHVLFSLSPAILLSGCFMVIFSLFTIRFVFKPVMVVLLLTSSAAMYAMLKYNVMIDYSMIENIFETNSGEAYSYINAYSVGYVLAFGVLPSIWLLSTNVTDRASVAKTVIRRVGFVVLGLAVIGAMIVFFYKDYASVGRNNQYLNKMIIPAHIYNTAKYINQRFFSEKLTFNPIGQDAQLVPVANGKPTLMVLVVGETARAQNMAYNGYQRNTNPYTQDLSIIALQNVSSCGTATAHSLPCMFSNLTHNSYNREAAEAQNNVLDVIKAAGVEVTWFDNDGGDKAVGARINTIDISPNENNPLCDGLSCYDEILVEKLTQKLQQDAQTSAASGKGLTNQFIALHTIGSHGPTYWQRYPADKASFTPECSRSDIENCSDQEIINVYDNTIAYTDFVLAKTIKVLEQYQDNYNVALVYLSDHGESLGESGMYLHGTPYSIAPSQQTHVPWFMWLPQEYTQAKGVDRECIADHAQTASYSHDNLFHSLLGLYGVNTSARDAKLDITSNCKLN